MTDDKTRGHGTSGNYGNSRKYADSALSCFLRRFRFFRGSVVGFFLMLLVAAPVLAQSAHPVPPIAPRLFPPLYAGLSIADLRGDSFGEGAFRIVSDLGNPGGFQRSLVVWESDGLEVYGFMDVPNGEGPFPVVIVIHGYVDPAIYNTLTYTTRYADALARAGYIAIHPNLRGYPPSDEGPNLIRVGFARDILHLIADIQEQAGIAGDALEFADAEHIGIWGHSMGGGITQRVLAVNDAIDAAILYGAMSGDEQRNHERIRDVFSGGARGNWEDDATAPTVDELARISPINFIGDYSAPIAIHHGTLDDQVPLEWSQEVAQLLADAGKHVEYYEYEGQPHTFVGAGDTLFIQRMIDFYDRFLKE